MTKNLMIVESPAKAKTIEKFLGKDFTVKSCFGHIRDLPKGNNAIDVKNNFEPTYEISPDKKAIVAELKKIAKKADEVWLATDEDREGEAISWHLCEALGLKVKSAKRIVFHEITKEAIQQAVKNPRTINENLVNAQQARRILDRLVGFELSPILWRKVKPSLSAGRVQSVAVRLIVEREREINNFKIESSYKVSAIFLTEGKTFKAELSKKIKTEKEAQEFLKKCMGTQFTVGDIQVKPGKRSPAAPFTTSTLQQEASRKLGFSVARTMVVAQKLYEAGKITYMRTDSVNLSETAVQAASKEIISAYGKDYLENRQYKTKSKSAQEAHEAIRPSYFNERQVSDGDEQRLYELIWKRAIASQMSDAEMEKTTAQIKISTTGEELTATGQVIKFDGFLTVYSESLDDETEEDDSAILPPLQVGQQLNLVEMNATERFSRPPSRYTEASLVKKLEELGIGRPSTYAPTISTIQKRGYVLKGFREGQKRNYIVISLKKDKINKEIKDEMTGADKGKLAPADIGTLVNDFLVQHFEDVMNYGFTAEIEKEFDEIAEGQLQWNKMIEIFYKPFHKDVEKTLETAERVTGERELGEDSKTGKKIIARMGKYGPMVQIGSPDDEEKPRYAALRPGQNIETITLEDALELFKLPRVLGEFENEEVKVSIGRFGPYILYKGKFISLKKEFDPYTITLPEAQVLIEEKRLADENKFIMVFEKENIQVVNGRFGPYIKAGDKNVKIPKDKEPKSLTLEECLELVKTAPEKKKRFFKRKK